MSLAITVLLLITFVPCQAQTNELLLQAESYTASSNATETVYGGITYETVNQNGYLTFNLNIPESGRYSLNLRASGQNETSVNLALDSIPFMQANVRKTGSARSFDDNFYICKQRNISIKYS